MMAFVVLLLAAMTRLIPHAMGGVGMGFTAVGGGLLFFGSRRPRWQAVVAMAVMAATDVYLTTQVYGRAFHVQSYLVTWAWYAAVALTGSVLLRKVTVVRAGLGVLASATSFFVVSNFMVWMGGHMYGRTIYDLGMCYVAGLPFYGRDLVATTLTVGVLFGLPVLAAKLVDAMRGAQSGNAPLA